MNIKHILTLIAALIMAVTAAGAQNLSRSTPSARRGVHRVVREVVIASDTLAMPSADSISISAYEKPLRVMRESFTINNYTDRPLESVTVDITYRDMTGKMLHRASHTVAEYVPPGESRRVSVPAFDTTSTYYYTNSARPRHPSKAIPYDVEIVVTALVRPAIQNN